MSFDKLNRFGGHIKTKPSSLFPTRKLPEHIPKNYIKPVPMPDPRQKKPWELPHQYPGKKTPPVQFPSFPKPPGANILKF
jgi:hypothetical protein